jgi:hypothetical protein
MKTLKSEFFILLLSFFVTLNASAQNFNAGNLIVCRVGDGLAAPSSAACKVTLVEMTTGGSTVGLKTVDLPTAVSGSNLRLTQSGTAVSEGEVTLSADYRYVVCAGYDATIGTAGVASTTLPGTIGRVDTAGGINTSTYFSRTSGLAYSGNNLRSACTSDGSSFWGSGTGSATGGVRYIPLGTTGGAGTPVSTTITNTRVVNIFNNQLYVSSQTGAFSLSKVGTGLPTTTGNTISNLSGVAAGTDDAYSYVFFDVNGNGTPDLLYYAAGNGINTANSGIYKYSSSDEGGTWTARGKLQGLTSYFPRGITGRKNCNGSIDLYFTAGAGSARPTKVYSFTDNATYLSNITSSGSNINAVSALIYTAATNYVLGGICFTPTRGNLSVNSNTTIAAGSYQSIKVNSGTLTLGGNVTVSDSVIVGSGATLNCGINTLYGMKFILSAGATLRIGSVNGITNSASSGNIQTSCRSYSTAANYEYIGSSSQVTGDGLPSTINNFTINNSSGVTLSNAVKVDGVASFTSGLLSTTSINLLTISSSGSITGASNSSFASGPVRKIGNSTFIFPVGKGAIYAPISISAPSLVTDHFTAEYMNTNPLLTYDSTLKDATINQLSNREYWNLERTNGSSDVSVGLSWESSRSRSITNMAEVMVAHWDLNLSSPIWKDLGNSSTSGSLSSGSLTTLSAVNSFSPFTLALINSTQPTPIKLLSFTAVNNGKNDVDLKWQTATETNNDFFTVERSNDGINFQPIETVDGAGNSSQLLNYSIIDHTPESGVSYYRLKQTDFNGAFFYSTIVSVAMIDFSETTSVNIFPNPTNGIINVEFEKVANKVVNIEIVNVFGQLVYSDSRSVDRNLSIDLAFLQKGIYMLKLKADGYVYNKKVVKK